MSCNFRSTYIYCIPTDSVLKIFEKILNFVFGEID